MTSALLTENTELKKRLREMEKEKIELEMAGGKKAADNLG